MMMSACKRLHSLEARWNGGAKVAPAGGGGKGRCPELPSHEDTKTRILHGETSAGPGTRDEPRRSLFFFAPAPFRAFAPSCEGSLPRRFHTCGSIVPRSTFRHKMLRGSSQHVRMSKSI